MNRLGGEHLSWENLVDSRGFVAVYQHARTLMDRKYGLGKPMACLAMRVEPRSGGGWDPSLVEGGRELTLQALAQRLRQFPRGESQVAPAVLARAGDLLFLYLPGRGAATHGTDVADFIEAIARTPWPVTGGFIPRDLIIGMAFWSPAMVSHDPMVLLGSAFQALVLASCGGSSPLPESVRVHAGDELMFSALLWEGPRRAPGTAPIIPTAPPKPTRTSVPLPPGVAMAREALRSNPDVPALWQKLAAACEEAGMNEQAMVARGEAKRRMPGSGPIAEVRTSPGSPAGQDASSGQTGPAMMGRKDRMQKGKKPGPSRP